MNSLLVNRSLLVAAGYLLGLASVLVVAPAIIALRAAPSGPVCNKLPTFGLTVNGHAPLCGCSPNRPSCNRCSGCTSTKADPQGIAYDPVNKNVYVADFNSNTVSVLDGASNRIVATVNVGVNPEFVAYDSANQEIYVTNSGSNTVTAISSDTNNVVATIDVGSEPYWLAFDPANNEMFVTNYNFPNYSNTVSAIDSSTNTVVATITVGVNPLRLAYDPANGGIYVDDYSSGGVSVINSQNTVVATLSMPGNPNTIGYDPANGDMYVTSNNSNEVTVVSSATNTVLATVTVRDNPYGAIYDPANNEMYVSSTIGNTEYAINSNMIATAIPVGAGPYSATYDPANGRMLVSNEGLFVTSTTLSVIDSATDTVLDTIAVGTGPDYSVFNPSNNDVYVSDTRSDAVSVVSQQDRVVSTINLRLPCSACVDSALISEQATSLTMPGGSDLYIFGFATGGCCPTGDFTSGQYASVNDNDGFRIAGLAVTSSNMNSYPSQTAYNTIGGAAVSGFSSYASSYQAITGSGPNLGVSDTFTVTKENSLVVVFAIGGGSQCQQFSGVPALTTDANTLNLNPIITIGHSYSGPGTYTATANAQQCAAGQDPNHAGDLIGVFVFAPGKH